MDDKALIDFKEMYNSLSRMPAYATEAEANELSRLLASMGCDASGAWKYLGGYPASERLPGEYFVFIQCIPGFDGGLPEGSVLRVVASPDKKVVVSSSMFFIDGPDVDNSDEDKYAKEMLFKAVNCDLVDLKNAFLIEADALPNLQE